LDKEVDGRHPFNIDEFWQAWFSSLSPGHAQAMRDIWYEHGELKTGCCLGLRGNVNGDPEERINLADISDLIDHVYLSQAPIPCPEEGNANGDPQGVINLADITCLIAHVYLGSGGIHYCP
jgi:hypothetical protein